MNYVWACSCGHEAACTREDQVAGAVYQCQGCKQIWGAVRPRAGGGPKWVPIEESLAEFHGLLDSPEEEPA